MPKKRPDRFISVDPNDRESFACSQCGKIRSSCRHCNCCYEHCQCDICDLCNEDQPCLCFYCPDCRKHTLADDSVIDDGQYDKPFFNPALRTEEVCAKCYEKRVRAWEKKTGKKAAK